MRNRSRLNKFSDSLSSAHTRNCSKQPKSVCDWNIYQSITNAVFHIRTRYLLVKNVRNQYVVRFRRLVAILNDIVFAKPWTVTIGRVNPSIMSGYYFGSNQTKNQNNFGFIQEYSKSVKLYKTRKVLPFFRPTLYSTFNRDITNVRTNRKLINDTREKS